jgi:hypothetical protein
MIDVGGLAELLPAWAGIIISLLHPIPVNVFAKPRFFIIFTLLSALPVFAQSAVSEVLPASSPYRRGDCE